MVSQVTPGSPAETAGIKAGDVITHVNHTQIKGSSDLRNKIGLMRIGEKVTLTVIRDGDKKDVDMVVGEIKETATEQAAASVPKLEGATFGSIPEASPLFGKMEGVLVLDVVSDSPAWRAGLRKDDVITSVNRQPVKTAEEFAAAASASSGSLLLNIRRGEGALFILIR